VSLTSFSDSVGRVCRRFLYLTLPTTPARHREIFPPAFSIIWPASAITALDNGPSLGRRKYFLKLKLKSYIVPLSYSLALACLSFHFYTSPLYNIDMLQYMGNALLRGETDIVRIHREVYSELAQQVPADIRDRFTGTNPQNDDNGSMGNRARNPYEYAEFLPFFALRPMYNSTLYWVSRRVGLIRAMRLLSVLSYFGIGIVLYVWLRHSLSPGVSALSSILLMLIPPMTMLARFTGSDGVSTLVAFLALYLVMQRKMLTTGLTLMLASIYFRTDNVVLLAPVLALCWLEEDLEFWKAAVLGTVGVVSVLLINHFAGDYGIQMLYYRNFVGSPVHPAEIVIHFSPKQYLEAFLTNIKAAAYRDATLFLLLGGIGFRLNPWTRRLALVVLCYAVLHYLLLPSWLERWYILFYLGMGITAVRAIESQFWPATMLVQDAQPLADFNHTGLGDRKIA
jgi:hypothetical protein